MPPRCPGSPKEEKVLKRPIVAALCVLLLGVVPAVLGTLSSPPKPAKRRAINLPGRIVQAPFSDAVLLGDTLYLSGRIGIEPKTGKPPENVEQEIRLLLDGMKATLAEAGMTMDDLVSVQVFCADLSLYDKFNAAYRGYFTRDLPARAFIGAGSLLRGGRFEAQGIAVKR
jgi:2-iminobutanoate/2-iminopropanoate deaminase